MIWSRVLAPILAVCMMCSVLLSCSANNDPVVSESDAAGADKGVYVDMSDYDGSAAPDASDDESQPEGGSADDDEDAGGSWFSGLLPAACAKDDAQDAQSDDADVDDTAADDTAQDVQNEQSEGSQTGGGWFASCQPDYMVGQPSSADAAPQDVSAPADAAVDTATDSEDAPVKDVSYFVDKLLGMIELPSKPEISAPVSDSDLDPVVSDTDLEPVVSDTDASAAASQSDADAVGDSFGDFVDGVIDFVTSLGDEDTAAQESANEPEPVVESEPAAEPDEEPVVLQPAPEAQTTAETDPLDYYEFPALTVASANTLEDGEGTVLLIGDKDHREDLVVTVMSSVTHNVVVILNSVYSEGHDPDVKAIMKHFAKANNVYIYRQDIAFFARVNEEAICEIFHSDGTPYDGTVYLDPALARPEWLNDASVSMLGTSDMDMVKAKLADEREICFSPYRVEAFNMDVYRYFGGFSKIKKQK